MYLRICLVLRNSLVPFFFQKTIADSRVFPGFLTLKRRFVVNKQTAQKINLYVRCLNTKIKSQKMSVMESHLTLQCVEKIENEHALSYFGNSGTCTNIIGWNSCDLVTCSQICRTGYSRQFWAGMKSRGPENECHEILPNSAMRKQNLTRIFPKIFHDLKTWYE